MFYKIECKETLSKIDAFFEKHSAIYNQIKLMGEKYGFDSHITSDSPRFGEVRFHNFAIEVGTDFDKTLWKTSKCRKGGYLNIMPRASAKKHKAEYDSLRPKALKYDELEKLIIAEGQDTFFSSYGYRHKKGEYFMFETSLKVNEKAIEIVGSEYNKE